MTWYEVLLFIFIGAYWATAIAATLQVKALGDRLGYVVRSKADLVAIKKVIDLNMKFALCFTITLPPIIICVILLREFILFLMLGPGLFLLSIWGRAVEKRFKEMQVAAADPRVAPMYHLWIQQWKQVRFGLPSDDLASWRDTDVVATTDPTVWPPPPRQQ